MPHLLSDAEVAEQLTILTLWSQAGQSIKRTIECDSFAEAIRAVNLIADVAEELNHHPDMDIRWRTVNLTLTTHEVGALSDRDFQTARAIDQCLINQ